MEVPKLLHKAQRQYRHNVGSEELIPGFDFEETVKIVNSLVDALNRVEQDINWMLNNGALLNRNTFDYIDKALSNSKQI